MKGATPPASLASPAAPALLDVRRLGISFGGLKAVQDFSLALPDRALYGLIGPNGAGKTTVFNLLTGVYRPDTGRMSLAGVELLGRKPEAITAAGLARTFQNIRLFGELSVLDNVRLVATSQEVVEMIGLDLLVFALAVMLDGTLAAEWRHGDPVVGQRLSS